ncbi:hypothetical protein PLEOSDRAFT_1098794 [Pleurotus ostreatus PC15]|uniref:Uncharacterized protein n=1 Tax=Pleurotus ostreatus (strain PC15) TaxID=1137138 RepID=A0A067P8V5_PLEO1|nr:hypothetical protein PLEOSDRAFT_1098794 [Pleurotus ostreatus PC15]
MTDWQSDSKISRNEGRLSLFVAQTRRSIDRGTSASLSRLVHVFIGIFIWECVMFLGVDWRFARHMKRGQPQMILGFLNRYFLLAGLIGLIVNDTVTTTVASLTADPYTSLQLQLCTSIAIELASTGLTLRILAVWGRMVPVTVFFCVCLLVQASLFLEAPIVGCVITNTGNLTPTLGYTFNTPYFLMLFASAGWVYFFPCKKAPLCNRISLSELCWFGAAFLASLVNTVFIRLNLNRVMAIIAVVPSTVVISIASGRVIRLWAESHRAFVQPETTEHRSTATQCSAYKQTRFSLLKRWLSHLGSPTREALDSPDFRRLSSPSSSHGSTVQARDSTRQSSITLPSLNSPSSTYIPNRASQNPSTRLDSDSETSAMGDRYDLDAQLVATERRNFAGTIGISLLKV